jgi:hypothetical protein
VEYEFLFRLARLGAFAFIDHPLIRYRFSADQFSGALHEGSMSLSIKRILCELPQTQPDVVARARGVYRRRLAACHLNVARVFAETDRWLAFRSAFQALRLGHVDRSIVSISARILLPGSVVRACVVSSGSHSGSPRRCGRPFSSTRPLTSWTWFPGAAMFSRD